MFYTFPSLMNDTSITVQDKPLKKSDGNSVAVF